MFGKHEIVMVMLFLCGMGKEQEFCLSVAQSLSLRGQWRRSGVTPGEEESDLTHFSEHTQRVLGCGQQISTNPFEWAL